MSKTLKTSKGTELPLTNLKGKDYLMVVYRLQWLNEDHNNFEITTELPLLTEDQTVARATVVLRDNNGKVIKSATATKRETKKDFPDHTEKAETAAVGRALAMLGFGTAQALSDLDEGNRIVDSPLAPAKSSQGSVSTTANIPPPASFKAEEEAARIMNPTPSNGSKSTFRKPSKPASDQEWM